VYDFRFRDVNFLDAGEYTCSAENMSGEEKENISLIVKG
jgi:hypothetical protein